MQDKWSGGLGKPGNEGVVDLFSGRCGAFSGRQRYYFFVNYIVLIWQRPLPANLLVWLRLC